MKKLLALACIVMLCVGLLIYSFLDRKPSQAAVLPSVTATPDEPTEPQAATADEPQQERLRFLFLNVTVMSIYSIIGAIRVHIYG
jgi:hypothetical protein